MKLALLAVLLLAGSAKAVTITGSATAGFSYNGCIQSGTQTSQAFVSFALAQSQTACVGFSVPIVVATVQFAPYAGSITLGGCNDSVPLPPPIITIGAVCTASVSLDGDYYFAGSGLESFNLGYFSSGCCGIANFVLTIDGQNEPVVRGGLDRVAIVQNLQLGEYHHITFSASVNGLDPQAFSYDLTTPGILGPDINPPPIPEPGAFLLCAGGLLVIAFRHSGIPRRFRGKRSL